MLTVTATEVRSRVEHELKPDMLEHVRNTAELARQLAEIHDVDPDRAELAALVHDIADRYSDRELLARASKYGIAATPIEMQVPKLLHGPVGAEILRREWGIDDEEILEAVRYHVSGTRGMSKLAKVLFVADKLEPGRDRHYGGLKSTRELAERDLDAAILKLYAWRVDELAAAGSPIHEHLVSSHNVLIENVRNQTIDGAPGQAW